MTATINGSVDEGYGPLADAFRAGLDDSIPMGAALAVRVGGRSVVDIWAGVADTRTGARWVADTVSVIFSCTKGLMSILAAQLVAEGLLSYDDLVMQHWPEYAAAGKERTTVAALLSHRAGLPALSESFTRADLTDWTRCVDALAAAAPLWEPGSAHAYHPITHGWLVGEVVRRLTGEDVGTAFAHRIADPLGADAWIGLPVDVDHRVAPMEIGDTLAVATALLVDSAEKNPWPLRAMTLGGALPPELVGEGTGFNDPRLRAAQIPGAGGVASARGLAAIWSATVVDTDGIRLLSNETLASALPVQSEGAPFFEAAPPWPRWGMGFQRDSAARRYLTSEGFGHDGAGGQVAFAEPDAKVGFAYLTNLMQAGDDRGTRIVDALRSVLG